MRVFKSLVTFPMINLASKESQEGIDTNIILLGNPSLITSQNHF
jgi:hypothetical protein